MTRREALPDAGASRAPPSPDAGVTRNPATFLYPLRAIEGSITPADMFFIRRSTFDEPDLHLEDWKLTIEGRVQHPYELNFSDPAGSPLARRWKRFLECAGNKASGSAASKRGTVGRGFSISGPARNSPRATGRAIRPSGSGGQRKTLSSDTPVSPYMRLLPLRKCMDAASLIAYETEWPVFFPASGNGFPTARLVSGLVCEVDSVKWLRRIVILGADETSRFDQSGMNRLYSRSLTTGTNGESGRVTEIRVKSAIAWPPAEQKLPAGKHRVWGFAWTGEGQIRAVSFSSNGGETWSDATLQRDRGPYRFGFAWFCPTWNVAPGEHVLMSRAVDDRGREATALERSDPKRKDGYELNWCLPVRCRVV